MQDDASASKSTKTMRVLAQIFGLIVSLAPIAYFVGLIKSQAYYTAIGSPWASDLLTPLQIASSSWGLMFALVCLSAISIWAILERLINHSSAASWAAVTCVTATLLMSVPFFSNYQLSPLSGASVHLMLPALLMLISAGISVGEIFILIQKNSFTFSGKALFIAISIAIIGLFFAPQKWGEYKGRLVIEDQERLPKVSLNNQFSKGEWRLVGAVGDSMLLISAASQPKVDPTFKLTSPSDIDHISSIYNPLSRYADNKGITDTASP